MLLKIWAKSWLTNRMCWHLEEIPSVVIFISCVWQFNLYSLFNFYNTVPSALDFFWFMHPSFWWWAHIIWLFSGIRCFFPKASWSLALVFSLDIDYCFILKVEGKGHFFFSQAIFAAPRKVIWSSSVRCQGFNFQVFCLRLGVLLFPLTILIWAWPSSVPWFLRCTSIFHYHGFLLKFSCLFQDR